MTTLRQQLDKQLPAVAGLPVVGLSAMTGSGAERLMPQVARTYRTWNKRITTAKLNDWLAKVTCIIAL